MNDTIYATLQDALGVGHFYPGQVVTLRGLAAEVGTSTMPVRDAVRRLAAEHAIELLPNRKIQIPAIDAKRFDQLWRLRTLLQCEATALAAENATPADIGRLEQLAAAIEARVPDLLARGAYQDIIRENKMFARSLYDLAQTPQLAAMIEAIETQIGPLYNVSSPEDERFTIDFMRRNLAKPFQRLLDAVRSGDGEHARRIRKELLVSYAADFRKKLALISQKHPASGTLPIARKSRRAVKTHGRVPKKAVA